MTSEIMVCVHVAKWVASMHRISFLDKTATSNDDVQTLLHFPIRKPFYCSSFGSDSVSVTVRKE